MAKKLAKITAELLPNLFNCNGKPCPNWFIIGSLLFSMGLGNLVPLFRSLFYVHLISLMFYCQSLFFFSHLDAIKDYVI